MSYYVIDTLVIIFFLNCPTLSTHSTTVVAIILSAVSNTFFSPPQIIMEQRSSSNFGELSGSWTPGENGAIIIFFK